MSILTINNILDKYKKISEIRKCDEIFNKPHINSKKASNAMLAYAYGILKDDILVQIDDTLFGSASD
jgi:hypothetical protein